MPKINKTSVPQDECYAFQHRLLMQSIPLDVRIREYHESLRNRAASALRQNAVDGVLFDGSYLNPTAEDIVGRTIITNLNALQFDSLSAGNQVFCQSLPNEQTMMRRTQNGDRAGGGGHLDAARVNT